MIVSIFFQEIKKKTEHLSIHKMFRLLSIKNNAHRPLTSYSKYDIAETVHEA